MQYKDFYKAIELPREATQDEIKRAYRKLARKYHPDVRITLWRFSGKSLRRARSAHRLQRDLGLNLAGIALVLDLMDELEVLLAQLNKGGG